MTDDLEPLIQEICQDYARPWTISLPYEPSPRTKQAAQAVQDEVRRRLGLEPVAWKLGKASEQDRVLSGDDVPTTGWLSSAMVHTRSAQLPLEDCSATIVECEIALELGKDLRSSGQALTVEEVADAVVGVRASIEVPMIRFTGQVGPSIHLMEATNTGSYQLIVGDAGSTDTVAALPEMEGLLEVNGVRSTTGGLPKDQRADPLRSLVYLANNLAQRGEALHAGQIVSTGVNRAPLPPHPGDYRFILPAVGEVRLVISEGSPGGGAAVDDPRV